MEFLWQREECFIWLPKLYEQRAQLKRLNLLFDLNGGALFPRPSLMSFVLQSLGLEKDIKFPNLSLASDFSEFNMPF